MRRFYAIMNVEDITQTMIDESVNSANSLRRSLDGTKCLIKFNMEFPNSMAGIPLMNREEVLKIINNSDWVDKTLWDSFKETMGL